MDIGRAFTYMFEDEDWIKKILIGGLLSIVPIVNFIPIGYFLDALNNIIDGQELPLPEWNLGEQFMKGLILFVASLIYSIPIILVLIVMVVVLAIGGSLEGDTGEGLVAVCIPASYCLMFLFGLLIAVIMPAAVIKYVDTGQFGAFFRFGEIFGLITSNLGSYIVALLLALAASVVAQIVGGIACGIGLLFTMIWAYLVAAHLFAQFYRPLPAQAS